MGNIKNSLLLTLAGFLVNVVNAGTIKFSYQDTLQDLVLEEEFIDTLISPLAITKDSPASTILDAVLTPEKDVTFHLFTRSNPDVGYTLKVGDPLNLNASPFRPSGATKIIIYGWSADPSTNWVHTFRKNYLLVGDYNVIIVDWFPTSVKEYSVVVKLSSQIGQYVAQLLKFLKSEYNISLADVHMLGHSIGAHIAGFAGSSLSGGVGRITGMDPARPGFEAPIYKDQKDRLDPSDAVFVDVIHSCAGTIGFIRAIGHADFYPNGGTFRQPGCSPLVSQVCSHGRSHQFMAESIIYPEAFIAVKCNSWGEYKTGKCSENFTTVMGENISAATRGVFFLSTNSEPPYGKGASKSFSL